MVYEPTTNTDGFMNQQPPQQIRASTYGPFEPIEHRTKQTRSEK